MGKCSSRPPSLVEPKVGWVFIATSHIITLIITREGGLTPDDCSLCTSKSLITRASCGNLARTRSFGGREVSKAWERRESTQWQRKDGGLLYIVLRTRNTCSGGVKYNVISRATQPTNTQTPTQPEK